ncbi:hypothetical protein [Thermosinus carboxydivorans]|uniref:hypothetical protein n=1 Tax=Thermosinus carboxydivorans TaxID=261685 RepID=UPI00031DF898|nr:hypothetical protein [Thermosinus carboxydivorans]
MTMGGVAGGAGMSGMAGCSGSQHSQMMGGAKNTTTNTNQTPAANKAQAISIDPNLGQKVDITV